MVGYFVGTAKFPITQNGKYIGALLAVSSHYPLGAAYAYEELPKPADNSVMHFFIDAMLYRKINGITASNRHEFQSADKDAIMSVTSSFNFVAGHVCQIRRLNVERPSERPEVVYATVDKDNFTGASRLEGASEGLAFVLAFLGFKLGDKSTKIVFTGFVNSIGLESIQAPLRHVLVQSIDCAGEKVEGCQRVGMDIFVPLGNQNDVETHMERLTQRFPAVKGRHDPYAPTLRGQVHFVRTVSDVITILDRVYRVRSSALQASGYYETE